jgi:hypothetical protein
MAAAVSPHGSRRESGGCRREVVPVFALGFLLGGVAMLVPVVIACVILDRRADARDRIRLRVDQCPMPLPGAYERPPERVLAGPTPSTVVDGEVLTERN